MRYLGGSTIRVVHNEKGLALVSALLLGLIGMLMVASLLLMVNTGTWIGGSKKRFQMALAASHGGLNFMAQGIIPAGLGGTPVTAGTYGGVGVSFGANLATKLTTTGSFGSFSNSSPWDITMTFPALTGPNTSVITQILNRSRGNTGATGSTLLESGGVVNTNPGFATPQHFPYLYQTETNGQGAAYEKATLSALYAY